MFFLQELSNLLVSFSFLFFLIQKLHTSVWRSRKGMSLEDFVPLWDVGPVRFT